MGRCDAASVADYLAEYATGGSSISTTTALCSVLRYSVNAEQRATWILRNVCVIVVAQWPVRTSSSPMLLVTPCAGLASWAVLLALR